MQTAHKLIYDQREFRVDFVRFEHVVQAIFEVLYDAHVKPINVGFVGLGDSEEKWRQLEFHVQLFQCDFLYCRLYGEMSRQLVPKQVALDEL